MTQGNVNLTLGLDTSPLTAGLRKAYGDINQGAQKAADANKPIGTSLEKVVQSAKKLGLTYDKVNRTFKDSKGTVQTLAQVKQRVDQLNASLAKTSTAAKSALNGVAAGFKQVLQGIPQGIGLAIGQQLLAPLTNFGSVLKSAVGGSVQTFVDIDAALRQTAAISGATEAQFEQLQTAVIGLAKDTKFTTGELAEASISLARAGFSAQEVEEALPGVAQGAAAAGQSMEQMSDVVISAMGGFQKGTDETIDVVDVLTQTANMSNQSVVDLGESLKYVGPIANGLGLTLEDTSAALGLLANAGIRGSQAGTTLRSGLGRLAAAAAGNNSEFSELSRGTGRLSETIRKLGADITTSNGDLKAMPELLKALKSSFEVLGTNEQQLVAKILFGDEAAAGFRALLGNTVEDIEKFAEATNNATGVAAETSEKNLAGIAGSLTFLSSAFDAASATVGKFLGNIVKPLVDGLTAVLNAFNGLPAGVQGAVVSFTALTVAVGLATAAFAVFKAAAGAGLFTGLVSSTQAVGAAFTTMATTLGGAVVKGYKIAGAAAEALSTILVKQISIKALAVGGWGKLKAAMAAIQAIKMKTILMGILGGLNAVVGALNGTATAASAAGVKMKAFLVTAAPLAALAAAIAAVGVAWDTYAKVKSGANEVEKEAAPIQERLQKILEKTGAEVKGLTDEQARLDKAWKSSVEAVGPLQARLDILRKGLGLTTAEEAKLNQETIKLGQIYGEVINGVSAASQAYREQAQALNGMNLGERATALKELAEQEKEMKKIIADSIKELEARNQKMISSAGGVKNLSDEQQTQINVNNSLIETLKASRGELDAVKGKYIETAQAVVDFNNKAAEIDPKEALKNANEGLKTASEAFKTELANMATAFEALKAKMDEGLKINVEGIKGQISALKDQTQDFIAQKDREIAAVKEATNARVQGVENAKQRSADAHNAAVAEIQKEGEAEDAYYNKVVQNIENVKNATSGRYKRLEEYAARAHQKVMGFLEQELAMIERQKAAVASRYDQELSNLRDLTPAERELARLEKQRLEDAARRGGEEGLRARAQLERMEANKKAAELEKQKLEEIAALEEKAAKKKEERQEQQRQFANEMNELQESMAEKEKARQEEIANIERKRGEAALANQRKIDEAKEAAQQKEKEFEDLILQVKAEGVAQVKQLEADKAAAKEEAANREKELSNQIKELEIANAEAKKKEEEKYNEKRQSLLDSYDKAIGKSNSKIVSGGKQAWGAYASNAIAELRKVEAAANRAAAAARNAQAQVAAASSSRWTGGPVSAGQTYTVNELGQEAFKSSTGKISLIDAPAYGNWKAPSKGTVINAAQTERMGLPGKLASEQAPAVGAHIDPRGGLAASSANGNESRNLLRAIAKATGGDNITNNVTIQAANTTQAASDMMVELTKVKRRRLR